MSEIEYHTNECLRSQLQSIKELYEYCIRWPRYCKRCNGVGGFYSTFDPSPSGTSLSAGSYTYFDPCPDCTELGRCARCGQPQDNDDPCNFCGFTIGVDSGKPDMQECYCYERMLS